MDGSGQGLPVACGAQEPCLEGRPAEAEGRGPGHEGASKSRRRGFQAGSHSAGLPLRCSGAHSPQFLILGRHNGLPVAERLFLARRLGPEHHPLRLLRRKASRYQAPPALAQCAHAVSTQRWFAQVWPGPGVLEHNWFSQPSIMQRLGPYSRLTWLMKR